jgi:hypothetical protein
VPAATTCVIASGFMANTHRLGLVGIVMALGCTGQAPGNPGRTAVAGQALSAAIELGAAPLALDPLGVPRLLGGGAGMPAVAGGPLAAARTHVERLAPAWGVPSSALPGLEMVGEVAVQGGTVVRLRQVIDGLAVAAVGGGELRVMVGPDGALVAASGTLIAGDTPRGDASFDDDDAGAIARAVRDVYPGPLGAAALSQTERGADGGRMLAGQAGDVHISLARARKAWFPTGPTLTAAWVVEAYTSRAGAVTGEAFRRVLAASDGRVLARTDLTADAAFQYRVFADTTAAAQPFDGPIVDVTPSATGAPDTAEYPSFVLPNLVTVDGLNHPGTASADPWLAAGSTETSGNNVDAYIDINAPDGLSAGDFRATVTAPGVFDRTYDTAAGPLASSAQQMAGVTALFYIVNWMHDFWYDGGFTEAAGNAQASNLGRGGLERDALRAEAQDNANGGSRNNANMATPSDGMSPRMQMFVWDNKDVERSLTLPGRTPATGSAAFSPKDFNLTGALVLGVDATAPANDACQALIVSATGKIVIVDRGGCSFKTKAINVQAAGGIAMIVANNAVGTTPPPLGEDATIATAVTIGALSVTQADGLAIKADIAAGAVTATLRRQAGADLDGTLDATVIAHEFGHYLHHRLSVCNTTLCAAMSEGWADFSALLMLARAGDNLDGAFPVGVYSTRGFAPDPVYYGIRRAPYSVTTAINSLSFRHMATGETLPLAPFNGGSPDNNAEVHNAGEVWASMLWEGYVALQKAAPGNFEAVRLKMRKYVVAGLLLAPPDATPTETRDALLAAVKAVSPADHDILIQAFARRGFGSCAVSPDRASGDFTGIVESVMVTGRLVAGFTSTAGERCDADDVLDRGESQDVVVAISNPGPLPLRDVVATLKSNLPGITIATPSVPVGELAVGGKTTVTFTIQLAADLSAPITSDLRVELSSNSGCGTLTMPIVARFNTDDRAASSASDTFDAGGSVWTPSSDLWSHDRKTPLDGVWRGADADAPSDASLVSPELTAGNDRLSIRFTHRFAFEAAIVMGAVVAFDGGVIEYSLDGGGSWQDIATLASPGYNSVLSTSNGTVASPNPLAGRPAYGVFNAAYPKSDVVLLELGTKLAGKQFKLRFRVGSDTNAGAPGWEISDIAFNGIVGTPFPTLVADTCGDTGGGCCETGGHSGGSAGIALLVVAVLLRRRRR